MSLFIYRFVDRNLSSMPEKMKRLTQGTISFYRGSSKLIEPGCEHNSSTCPISYSKQITFISVWINRSMEFIPVGNEVYRSFESTIPTRWTGEDSRAEKAYFSTLPSAIASAAVIISATAIYFNGRFDLTSQSVHYHLVDETQCVTSKRWYEI